MIFIEDKDFIHIVWKKTVIILKHHILLHEIPYIEVCN